MITLIIRKEIVYESCKMRKELRSDEVVKKKENSGDYTRLKLNEFSKSKAEVTGFFVKGNKKMVMERKIKC
ncbi:39176_t:CDS:2, partial [Gigaspora margarita]